MERFNQQQINDIQKMNNRQMNQNSGVGPRLSSGGQGPQPVFGSSDAQSIPASQMQANYFNNQN